MPLIKLNIPQPKGKHLISRGSFGVRLGELIPDAKQLFKESNKVIPLSAVEKPSIDVADLQAMKKDGNRKQMVKEIFNKSRQELMKVNIAWGDKMVKDPSLRERMTFFWHGHFACRTLVPYFAQQQNNLLRDNALGNFSDLVMGISKDPAMLQFLNNQQNRKDHPNENFAREVMELFTLGRGNYTEQDVKEAARAFTGWAFNLQGEYQFRQRQHDFGNKNFRGKSNDFTGEQILNAILDDKHTAKFITTKIYRAFVSDQPASDGIVDDWSASFYRSGYNIEKLMQTIFQSDEFNNPSRMGNKIKSPIELLLGLRLNTGGEFENPQSFIFLQRALGQVLFYPPNVSGWTSGKGWIDSTSLSFRVALPKLLFAGVETDFEASDDGDANGLGKAGEGKKRLHCKADWASISHQFTKSSTAETLDTIESYLLSRPTTTENKKVVMNLASKTSNDEEFVKQAFIGFMSLPEYQLC